MSFTCRVYKRTGFNSVNLPDSPALLNNGTFEYTDYPALETLQSGGLSYIDIKVPSYDDIQYADYARVGDKYYSVDGANIQMLSSDTARLPLYLDSFCTAGGLSGFTILDGITERVHTATDNLGEWCEADPYMQPAQPLTLQAELIKGSTNFTTVVKSTLALNTMGTATSKPGVTYTDADSGETVTVPSTVQNTDQTNYYLDQDTTDIQLMGESKTKCFDVSYTAIKKALKEVNDLGINGAVTAQVALPLSFITPTIQSDGSITQLVGCDKLVNLADFPYQYAQVNNKKILYSSFTPFGIATAGGDKKEYDIQQMMISVANPVLRIVADPRTDGKPYFRFSVLNGDGGSLESFFSEAAAGLPWKQIPLVYEGEPGKALAQFEYNKNRQIKALQTKHTAETIKDVINGGAGMMAGGGLQIVGGGVFGGDAKSVAGGIESYAKGFATMYEAGEQGRRLAERQEYERMLERMAYRINTEVYVPEIDFPFSSDLYNDLYNNPCMIYRYKYTAADITRIDKILTMYGYKVTKVLEKSDFTNRKNFNFIQAGVSCGGTQPKWLLDGIARQLSGGVRIWHRKPDPAYLSNNPIVTTGGN